MFCPYNYIIDPVIRAAMDVDISNAVLIFDEAHNIEDSEPLNPILFLRLSETSMSFAFHDLPTSHLCQAE